jgi:hypothetical protein
MTVTETTVVDPPTPATPSQVDADISLSQAQRSPRQSVTKIDTQSRCLELTTGGSSTPQAESTPVSRLPDLLSIRPTHPTAHSVDSLSSLVTKPFSLAPLPYTDDDVPLPQAYNDAYPHPLTAYASKGVNPAVVQLSGYGKALEHMLRHEPDKARGTILSQGSGDAGCVPSLSLGVTPGGGNAVPEKLWSRFESVGAVRLPVGVAGVSPYAGGLRKDSLHAARTVPPRFAPRESIPSTPPATIMGDDYFARLSPRHSGPRDEGYVVYGDDETSRRFSEYESIVEKPLTNDSPFYKTEMCAGFDAGVCKYGKACQVRSSPKP